MKHFALICGVKNSGKTTLIEHLVHELAGRGLNVCVIKHDGHDFVCDKEGTDSWRFVEAGAIGAAVFSRRQLFVRRLGSFPSLGNEVEEARAFLRELCGAFPDADVILAEGGKELPLPKIEVVRSAISNTPVSNPKGRFLIVTDLPGDTIGERTLPFSAIGEIADAALGSDASAIMGSGKERKPVEREFTHFDENGRAKMVDVGEKDITRRTAAAEGKVLVNAETFALIRDNGMKKGDVLGTAQIAGIMAAKRTPDLIPMCHPILIDGVRLALTLNETQQCVDIRAEVTTSGRTGVEMEALTAVSTAALTVYDMCKAVQRDMEITGIRLVQKTGGVHGDYLYRKRENAGGQKKEPVCAVLLRGGKSRRMGLDKAFLPFGERTFVQTIAAQMEMFGEKYLSAAADAPRDLPSMDGLSKDWILLPDIEAGCGPMGGIYSALIMCRAPWVLVVSCDIPNVKRELFDLLIREADEEADLIYPVTSRAHMTCALYRKTMVPLLQEQIRRGDYRLQNLTGRCRAKAVDLRIADENGGTADAQKWERMLRNVNTKEDLEELMQ